MGSAAGVGRLMPLGVYLLLLSYRKRREAFSRQPKTTDSKTAIGARLDFSQWNNRARIELPELAVSIHTDDFVGCRIDP